MTDDEIQAVLDKERARIAAVIVPLARDHGWCGQFEDAWLAVFPGAEPVDADGFTCRGWRGDTHIDGSTRPPMPTDAPEGQVWRWNHACPCGCEGSTGSWYLTTADSL